MAELPHGVGVGYLAGALATVFVVTVALRALPFVALRRVRSSQLVTYLGETMPAGVMVILVVYTLRDTTAATAPAAAVALVVTVVLEWWRRSPALSIVAGTALYLLLNAWWG